MPKIVKLTKIEEIPDAVHPNNRPVGEEHAGLYMQDPQIGGPFVIYEGPTYYLPKQKLEIRLSFFVTSKVVEILSHNTFRTLNSVYQWNVMDLDETEVTKLN